MIIKTPPTPRSFFVLTNSAQLIESINIFNHIYYACIIFFPNFEFIRKLR